MGILNMLTLCLGASLLLVGCNQQAQVTPTSSPAISGQETPEAVATADPQDGATPSGSATPEPKGPAIAHDLKPLPGKEAVAPTITKKMTVKFVTNAGEVVMEVYPEAAPNAVARFLELVKSGFYNDTPVSRVIPGFMAQFGINWRDGHKDYQKNTFNDDPSFFSLDRGTLAFAKAGINNNSTQVFINYANNDRLADPVYGFTTFGKVIKGIDVVEKFAVVGDPEGGLDQQRLWEDGGNFLESLDKKPTMIEKVTVVE